MRKDEYDRIIWAVKEERGLRVPIVVKIEWDCGNSILVYIRNRETMFYEGDRCTDSDMIRSVHDRVVYIIRSMRPKEILYFLEESLGMAEWERRGNKGSIGLINILRHYITNYMNSRMDDLVRKYRRGIYIRDIDIDAIIPECNTHVANEWGKPNTYWYTRDDYGEIIRVLKKLISIYEQKIQEEEKNENNNLVCGNGREYKQGKQNTYH